MGFTDNTVLIHTLLAMRAQLEAMHASVSAALSVLVPEMPDETDGCPHPPEKRVKTTVQGGPDKFMCLVCECEIVSE